METSPNRQDSKEISINTNGNRSNTSTKSIKLRLDRSSSRHTDDNETNIIRSNTASSLTEQNKPDELVSGRKNNILNFYLFFL